MSFHSLKKDIHYLQGFTQSDFGSRNEYHFFWMLKNCKIKKEKRKKGKRKKGEKWEKRKKRRKEKRKIFSNNVFNLADLHGENCQFGIF